MVDFLRPDDLDKIKEAFEGVIGEPTGILVVRKGKLKYKPIPNISEDPENEFILDPRYFVLEKNIIAIVHAHPDNCKFSAWDITSCEAVGIPYIVFNRQTMEYSTLVPKKWKPLNGNRYLFGKHDCFEAARNWYMYHGVYFPERSEHWEDDWFLHGKDYISEEIRDWGFFPVSDLQYGDLLIFGTTVPSHMGVYEDKDMFYHHAHERLSGSENLYPYWASTLLGVYRHEKTSSIRRLSR